MGKNSFEFSLCIPPTADLSFLDEIQTILDKITSGSVIIGGDLNNISSKLDRSGTK